MRQAASSHTLTSARTPWTWFLLGSVTLLFFCMILWGFCGGMVGGGRGIGGTLLSGGVRPIVAGGSGILSHLNIQAGSQVFADQVVGKLYNPGRLFTVRKLEMEYTRLTNEVAFMQQGMGRMTGRMVETEQDKVAHLEKLAELQEQSKKRARELSRIYGALTRTQSMSLANYYQMLDQTVQTELSFLSTYLQVAEAIVSSENRVWQQELKLLELRRQIDQKQEERDLSRKLHRESDWLVLSFDGRVMEVLK